MACNQIDRMLPRHHEILKLALMGLSHKVIAERMGMTPVGIGLVVNSPIFQDNLARRRESIERKSDEGLATSLATARDVLNNAAEDAAKVHVAMMMDDKEDRVRQFSANSILDRVGLAKAERQGGGGDTNITIDGNAVVMLQLALEEA